MHSRSRKLAVAFLAGAGVCLALPGHSGGSGPRRGQGRPPNILLIVADDLGWGDVGFHGSEIHTPRLDRLAAESVELERFYVQPLCTPTRAGLFTGRSPIRLGLQWSTIRSWSERGLDPREVLLPELLRRAGYRTALVGKWHLGHASEEYLPRQRGFDSFYGHLTGTIDYYEHAVHGSLDWQRDGASVREEGYSTHLLAREAVRTIEQSSGERPFFLCLAFNAPHAPLQSPPGYRKRYASIPDVDRRIYANMVQTLDGAIGSVLDALDARGLREDTLVWFLSDNGAATAQGGSNRPLRGGKGNTFEGGIRVPSLVRCPSLLPGGRRTRKIISFLDVLPTLLGQAGADPPEGIELDGRDAWPLIDGSGTAPEVELHFAARTVHHSSVAIISPRWKMIRETELATDARTLHLYQVDRDPMEGNNLGLEEPSIMGGLHGRLVEVLEAYPEDGLTWERLDRPAYERPADLNILARPTEASAGREPGR